MADDTTEEHSFESLLGAWDEAVAGPPRPGRHRNDVRTVFVAGQEYVGRLSRRSSASIAWELALLQHLADCGVPVPSPLPTTAGAGHSGGLVLSPRLTGPHPDSDADWDEVASTLRRIHEATKGWPQRPDPAEGREPPRQCKAALAELPSEESVIVGRTRRHDITMTPQGPAFVDWDESRVGPPALDFLGEAALALRSGLTRAEQGRAAEALTSWQQWRALPV
jgi:aminoglycoside phosphotransferase (APT) family kinase protein